MSARTRFTLEETVITMALFMGAVYLYYIVAAWGISDHLVEGTFRKYVMGPWVHWEALITGVGFGVLLSVVNHWSESPRLRRLPFGIIVLLKSALYLLSLFLVTLLVHAALRLFVLSGEEFNALMETVTSRFVLSAAAWLCTSIVAINFVHEVRHKVGPGNMLALLTGRYQRPRTEERIFLFLDLKGSTSIAERLGSKKYSQFLRHCYHDLTEIVLDYGAQIYQYVGDEVVLTWPAQEMTSRKRCLEAFFAFHRKLREQRSWYEVQFGVSPLFRGSVDTGHVTVAEVGDIKREIAFHGDPLNRAARLLELCKELGRDFLISGHLREAISTLPDFDTEWQGNATLRGKKEKVAVYGVSLASPRPVSAR